MLQKLAHPVISYSLVAIQFACIAVLLWFEPWLNFTTWLIPQFLGITLGLWAVATMHLGHFNIVPDPMPDSKLVTTGPYRWIRHPMYSSLHLFFLPTLVHSESPFIWVCYGILVIDLIVKLQYEEKLLNKAFHDYHLYQSRTKRLIPYLF
jgi:protein-S-isoprenylcysteine O-methyltransferase Ste14